MIHKTCSINYGHLADLQKFATGLNKKNLSFDKISPRDFYFFPFFSICTCDAFVTSIISPDSHGTSVVSVCHMSGEITLCLVYLFSWGYHMLPHICWCCYGDDSPTHKITTLSTRYKVVINSRNCVMKYGLANQVLSLFYEYHNRHVNHVLTSFIVICEILWDHLFCIKRAR